MFCGRKTLSRKYKLSVLRAKLRKNIRFLPISLVNNKKNAKKYLFHFVYIPICCNFALAFEKKQLYMGKSCTACSL